MSYFQMSSEKALCWTNKTFLSELLCKPILHNKVAIMFGCEELTRESHKNKEKVFHKIMKINCELVSTTVNLNLVHDFGYICIIARSEAINLFEKR